MSELFYIVGFLVGVLVRFVLKVLVVALLVVLVLKVVGASVSAPAELRRDEKVPCSDECVHPEDAWCSGATPDCPSHWEAWNSLPPTCH